MVSLTIFDVKRFAVHDGPGIRTTVFLKGCPLDCWWCHNPESRKKEPEKITYKRKVGGYEVETSKVYGRTINPEELMDEILKDKIFFEESGGGVTFSGGEPLYQIDGLVEMLKRCKLHGMHTVVDTSGYAHWSSIERILPYTDLFLYDLKLIDPQNHQKYTGVNNDLIMQNLEKLLQQNIEVELRIPIVPGVNDSQDVLKHYQDFLEKKLGKAVRISLLTYHNIGDNKYQKLNAENRMKGLANHAGLSVDDFKRELASSGFLVETGG